MSCPAIGNWLTAIGAMATVIAILVAAVAYQQFRWEHVPRPIDCPTVEEGERLMSVGIGMDGSIVCRYSLSYGKAPAQKPGGRKS